MRRPERGRRGARIGRELAAWLYPDQALQLVALRADRDATALWAWWTQAAPVPVG